MRRVVAGAAASALIVALAACGTNAAEPSGSGPPQSGSASIEQAPTGVVTISSSDVPAPLPITATVAESAPKRIVSLATGVGETLAALGVGDRVVGRDETSDAPQISSAEIVTKAHSVSAEKVLALDPDLVIVDASTAPPEATEQIRDAGVTVVEVPQAWTLAEIGPRTRAVAAAVGVTLADADTVVAEATTTELAASTAADRPRVAFLYLRGTSAIYLIGGERSGADSLIEAAGGVDVGAEAGYAAFVPLTAEAVAMLDPEVILVMMKGLESVGGVDGLLGLPGIAQTAAARDRRIIAVDDTLLLSFGPRTGSLVESLSRALGTNAS